MALTPSTMRPLGTPAPELGIPDIDGHPVVLDDFKMAQGLVVAFLCNHCPYVKHVREGFAAFGREYMAKGIAIVAVNSNDAAQYPDDAPDKMVLEVHDAGYPFPYLYDAAQTVAKAYRAACTPDFFLFDGDRNLAYRGQFDGSRPGNSVPVTGADLRAACDAVLAGQPVPGEQKPSLGCNIKWKAGEAPDWAR